MPLLWRNFCVTKRNKAYPVPRFSCLCHMICIRDSHVRSPCIITLLFSFDREVGSVSLRGRARPLILTRSSSDRLSHLKKPVEAAKHRPVSSSAFPFCASP